MIATLQAVGFTTIYLGGAFAVMGINPIKKYKELKAQKDQMPQLPCDLII